MSVDLPRAPDWPALERAVKRGQISARLDASTAAAAHHLKGQLVYLSCPFARSNRDDLDQFDRLAVLDFEVRAARWVKLLAVLNVPAACPAAMRCQMLTADMENELRPLDGAFWAEFSRPFLFAAGAVVVPPMPGWRLSREVWADVCWALQSNVPVWQIRRAG
ncbi:DUF1937 family protein [Falsiruegeria mediterranea]|uniref:DUF1937 domain-containing protein n=1 Tax=Falsiruegeria mediterranea M17 TaxID=1200281 RepID=A0A2R8C5D5_9RHOB|nr:DUF1937 family protein [Falsiruegeria mediterranea]SPJ27645.1 hypothetical protein TRM7615_01135 [Falsiruegeria mediterranea M17]